MMQYIELPEEKTRRLSFYLAMEEYVACHTDGQDCFFMWQVEPSVIFGRNQLIENEVNIGYCHNHHIRAYRRKSGGGCVYADMGNVMFSYITSEEAVSFTFSRYLRMIVGMLREMHVDAHASGRNDVMIGDKKVSGNAFYRMARCGRAGRGRSIVHGTMLYDANMENMVGALTPPGEKLSSKGVTSVRQHVALLKDYTDMDIEQFKQFAKASLCQSKMMLSHADVTAIEQMERAYLSEEFIYGNNPKYTIVRKGRIEDVGCFEVRIELKNDEIRNMAMYGDYFIVGDVDSDIIHPLRGVRLERNALKAALPEDLGMAVHRLKRDAFVELLLGT